MGTSDFLPRIRKKLLYECSDLVSARSLLQKEEGEVDDGLTMTSNILLAEVRPEVAAEAASPKAVVEIVGIK